MGILLINNQNNIKLKLIDNFINFVCINSINDLQNNESFKNIEKEILKIDKKYLTLNLVEMIAIELNNVDKRKKNNILLYFYYLKNKNFIELENISAKNYIINSDCETTDKLLNYPFFRQEFMEFLLNQIVDLTKDKNKFTQELVNLFNFYLSYNNSSFNPHIYREFFYNENKYEHLIEKNTEYVNLKEIILSNYISSYIKDFRQSYFDWEKTINSYCQKKENNDVNKNKVKKTVIENLINYYNIENYIPINTFNNFYVNSQNQKEMFEQVKKSLKFFIKVSGENNQLITCLYQLNKKSLINLIVEDKKMKKVLLNKDILKNLIDYLDRWENVYRDYCKEQNFILIQEVLQNLANISNKDEIILIEKEILSNLFINSNKETKLKHKI